MSWREGIMALILLVAAIFLWQLLDEEEPQQNNGVGNKAVLPGYYLNDAELTRFNDAGIPAYTISALRIEQNTLTDELKLEDINIVYHEHGNWNVSADLASLPANRESISFTGNVIAHQKNAQSTTRFTTESLTYNVKAQELSTNELIRAKKGKQSISAKGMLIDLQKQRVKLKSQVKIRIAP